MSSSSSVQSPPPQTTTATISNNFMLPGPPSRNNFGSADLLSTTTSSHSHLLLVAGDRQGRICIIDPRVIATKSISVSPIIFLQTDPVSKLGVQDLNWIRTGSGSDSWIIAAITRSSLLSLFQTSVTDRCFFKYDVAPEVFSSVQRDPFDSRHFVVVAWRRKE